MQNEMESKYVEFEEIKEDDTNVVKWYQAMNKHLF